MAEQTVRTDAYDAEVVVEEIARGVKSYAEIAAEQGCSRQCISQIARGRRRKDLQRRVVELQEGFLLQVRRLAVACAVQAMAMHIQEGLEGVGETARKCREYVLNHVLGKPGGVIPDLPRGRPAEFDIDAMMDAYDEQVLERAGVIPHDGEADGQEDVPAPVEEEGEDLQRGNCNGAERQADAGGAGEEKGGHRDGRTTDGNGATRKGREDRGDGRRGDGDGAKRQADAGGAGEEKGGHRDGRRSEMTGGKRSPSGRG